MKLRNLLIICLTLFVVSCATAPPQDIHNICSIFREYPKWYWAAQDVQKKWRVPISVLMAIVYQESKFRAGAKPPRKRLLWIIPWFRPTSAYGYSQATDGSWVTYKRATGKSGADRDAFSDAAHFIGWYASEAQRRARIKRGDPYRLYLAYHEGIGGYLKGTYRRKGWLVGVAKKVQRRAWTYHRQLMSCINDLPKKHWWNFL